MEEIAKLGSVPEEPREEGAEEPEILEEIAIEELAIDGICGVY
ncbi:MAG: variant-type mycofactocin precursor [Deferrisomatales bacterium]|nr:variant-type mycofactocin precursor [Deferrisomatales bacterium]